MGSKNTLLFFLLFTYNSIGEQDFCSDSTESFGTPFQNRALVGYIIKSLVTRGILSCNHKCLSLSSCSSYNYQASATQGGVCELNGGKGNIHQNLVKRHGFVFVLVRRKVKVTGILYFKTMASVPLILLHKPAKLKKDLHRMIFLQYGPQASSIIYTYIEIAKSICRNWHEPIINLFIDTRLSSIGTISFIKAAV